MVKTGTFWGRGNIRIYSRVLRDILQGVLFSMGVRRGVDSRNVIKRTCSDKLQSALDSCEMLFSINGVEFIGQLRYYELLK
jgi:hypothetical protein